jgi:Coenzyme PQQ synthesis protein D (PqqD)
MTLPYSSRLVVPDDVLLRELDGEAVLLNLSTSTYFGLDAVGTRFWAVLTSAPSVEAAYEILLDEYDVPPSVLHQDLDALLGQLMEHGLLEADD